MGEPDDLKALEHISNEVDNSQVKILISSHCMKAQAFLLDKLKKQAERQKEICKFIGSSNLKLETEIKFAEQEIKCLNTAVDTIKLGNIELNKEHLLSKESKAEICERTRNGKKKYENLWLLSKKRYESIPIVQKLMEAKNKNQMLRASIDSFITESEQMVNEIKKKKRDLELTDRAQVVELAEFLVSERAKTLITINENDIKIKEVLNEIETLEKEDSKNIYNVAHTQALSSDRKGIAEATKDQSLEDEWSTFSKISETDTLVLPKLHLQNNDLDIFSIRLDQINKVDSKNMTSMKRTISSTISDLEESSHKMRKSEENTNENYISSYFDIPFEQRAKSDKKTLSNNNYSEKKLIHILEDIKLDNNETYNIINKLEVNHFQPTNYINPKNAEQMQNVSNEQDEINKTNIAQEGKSSEIQETVEMQLTSAAKEDVVNPPSQFLDLTQSSQEKETVRLNIPVEKETSSSLEEDKGKSIEIKSQEQIVNISAASDDSYTQIKDKMLKQRNLDLSPQFVYSKSNILHKQEEDKITSKFFVSQNGVMPCNEGIDDVPNNIMKQDAILTCDEKKSSVVENETDAMNENNVVVSSPKAEIKKLEVPVAGFLFNHGAQGLPESLDLSISTTGFEDSEDFPHCIDSSLLLSPTANVPISTSHNNEVSSQEVPNFLAGFRKTTLSFFGSTTAAEPKPDSSESQSGGFNFAFGKEEKKGRGGFFSMFN